MQYLDTNYHFKRKITAKKINFMFTTLYNLYFMHIY